MFFFPKNKAAAASQETAERCIPRDFQAFALEGLDRLLLAGRSGCTTDFQIASLLQEWKGFHTLASKAEEACGENRHAYPDFLEELRKLRDSGLLLDESAFAAECAARFRESAPFRPPAEGGLLRLPAPSHGEFTVPSSLPLARLSIGQHEEGSAPLSGPPIHAHTAGSALGLSPACFAQACRDIADWGSCTGAQLQGILHPQAAIVAELWSDLVPEGQALLTRSPHFARHAACRREAPLPPGPPWEDEGLLLWQQTLLSSRTEAWLLVLPTLHPPERPSAPGLSHLLVQILGYQMPCDRKQVQVPFQGLKPLAAWVQGLASETAWNQARTIAQAFIETYHLPAWHVDHTLPPRASGDPSERGQLAAWAGALMTRASDTSPPMP
jgi:hypothetical protein